jgi:uncharacterized phage protein (TIGR02218 family)
MARTIVAGLATHLATRRANLARCVRLDLRDGTSLGITDRDVNLSVNLGDGAITYRADVGILPSDIELKVGLEADNLEIRGPISATVTRAAILGGRYDRATVRVFDVRRTNLAQFLRLLKGKVSQARVEGSEFVLEVRSLADSFNQTIGRILSPICSWDFGVFDPPHSRCMATPQTWEGEVTAVGDDLMTLEVTFTSPIPTAEDALLGHITFASGSSPPAPLDNLPPVEVFSYDPPIMVLYAPLVEAPTIGDVFTLTEGCDKTRPTCKLKDQILNFGGFPEVPGTDAYLKYPSPGG